MRKSLKATHKSGSLVTICITKQIRKQNYFSHAFAEKSSTSLVTLETTSESTMAINHSGAIFAKKDSVNKEILKNILKLFIQSKYKRKI